MKNGASYDPLTAPRLGYRLYDMEALDRIAFITHAKSAGFSRDDIGQLLAIRDNPEATCATVYGLHTGGKEAR